MVFAPSPMLTVTIERRGAGDEVHLHAGGQGYWIARMLAVLEEPVVLCGCFGGEAGVVIRTLIEAAGITVRNVPVEVSNGAYVHDRRTGTRVPVAEMVQPALSRHDLDSLYGAALVEGLAASVCVLGGAPEHVLPAEWYERLARDLRANHKTVVADLSGEQLRAVVDAGVDVLKVSHLELVEGAWARGHEIADIVAAMRELAVLGAEAIVVSRAEEGALVLHESDLRQVAAPRLSPIDSRGAGDSMTAGIAAGLARGQSVHEAIRLGTAAGSLNVTRRGLASGDRHAIERLLDRVSLDVLDLETFDAEALTPTTSPQQLAARVRSGA
jgi:1-phosphofructokinase